MTNLTIERHQSEPEIVCLGSVEPKSIEWLWEGRIALGKLSLIVGDPGLGKSLITIAMAATVSVGGKWPVDRAQAPKGSVILMSAEDDLADTIRPRLDAADADVSKIHAFTMVSSPGDNGERERRFFSLKLDLPVLERAIESIDDCKLVVIDPISAFTGGTDTHNNADVRGLLAPLAELAQRYGAAIVGVTHLNKGAGQAMYRIMGSLAFTAAARSVLAVAKDQDDPLRRLVMPVKNNLGNDLTGLAYKIGTDAANGAPVVQWEPDAITESIDEVLEQDSGYGVTASLLDDAKDWLGDALSEGARETTELQKKAKMAGHAWATVKRAKTALKVKPFKKGFSGVWAWRLPDAKGAESPKMLKEPQDAHPKSMSTFDDFEHLREHEAEYRSMPQEDRTESVVLPLKLNKPFVANAEREQPSGAGDEEASI